MSICNRDCFNCPFDDCICDEMTAEDYREGKTIDLFINPPTKKQLAIAAKQREYYEANRESIAAKQREYREANRESYNEYMRAYMRAYKRRHRQEDSA